MLAEHLLDRCRVARRDHGSAAGRALALAEVHDELVAHLLRRIDWLEDEVARLRAEHDTTPLVLSRREEREQQWTWAEYRTVVFDRGLDAYCAGESD
jgi:hypothetical protein